MKRSLYPLPLLCGLLFGHANAEDSAPYSAPGTPPPLTSPAPSASASPEEAETWRQQARALREAGKPEQALALLDQIILRFPDEAEGYVDRGAMLGTLKRYDAASADLRRATALKPDSAIAWGNLGWCLVLQREFAAAQTASARAQELAPDSYASTINLGHAFLLQGDRNTAHGWYQRTVPLIPDEEALTSGPLADFDLFIERGWQVEASREERAWLEAATKRALEEKLDHALAEMKTRLRWEAAPKDAKAWWEAFERQNSDRKTTVLTLFQELDKRDVTITEFFLAYLESDAKSIPEILEYIDRVFVPLRQAAISLEKGLELEAAGRYAEAEPLYRETLAIYRKVLPEGHPSIAISLNNLALLLQDTTRYGEAEPLYREALAINEKVYGREHPEVATVLNELAGLLQDTGRYTEAEPLYREALAIDEKAYGREHLEVAKDLNNLAVLLKTASRYAEAEPLYREALAIGEKAYSRAHPNVATVLNGLAGLLQDTGRYTEAEPLFREALAIDEKAYGREHPDVATDLNNLALLLQETGRYGEAEPFCREALAIDEKTYGREHPKVAKDLNNLALLLQTTGRYGEAELLYREALAIWQKALPAGHPKIATSLNNLALLLQETGRYGEAEPLYREALAIDEKAYGREHPDVAGDLNNLAALLRDTGRYTEAEPLYREALAIWQQALPAGHPKIATSLNNLAVLLRTTGRYAEAEPLYREVLAIFRKALPAGHSHIATSLNSLAALLYTTARYAEAEPLYREALAIFRKALPAGHPDIARGLNNLAVLLQNTGRSREAEPLYREALAIAQPAGAPEPLWTVQGELSQFYARQSQRPLAIFFGKQAVNTLQGVRQNLQSAEQATQQAFLKTKEGYYKDLADLLIAEGRLTEAETVLAMLKEQEYFDFVRRDAQQDPRRTQASYNDFEAEQLAIYEAGSRDLARLGAEYQALLQIKPAALRPDEQARLKALRPQLEAATVEFKQAMEAILATFQHLSAERRKELDERVAGLRLKDDHRGLVRDLGQEVALLHTLVMEDKVHLLLILPRVLLARVAPVGAADLNRRVLELRAALQDPRRDPRPSAQALYRHLIAPIAADLDAAGVKTLMVSLDGTLRYLPLAALHDGERYLAERYALSLFTAAARDKVRVPPKPEWTVAGFGVSQAHPGFSPLPSVPGELAAIVRAQPQEPGVLPGERHLDPTFTEDTLRGGLEQPVVHIASHFSLQPGNETASFLLLGDGRHLPLHQIRKEYDFGSLDLLTLSACQTDVGGQNAQGREVEGMGTLAQEQGAKGVLATLWSVSDSSTGLFMQHFYRFRQEQHLSKAEALRQAQLTLLRGIEGAPPISNQVRPDLKFPHDPARPYAHPYYWAPFILMGNWL